MIFNNVNELKSLLAQRLQNGCKEAIKDVQDNTPIDTQRLHDSIDSTDAEINDTKITCEVTIGGKELYGITKEQEVLKPVNYAIFVETRYHFVRNSLSAVTETILDNIKRG